MFARLNRPNPDTKLPVINPAAFPTPPKPAPIPQPTPSYNYSPSATIPARTYGTTTTVSVPKHGTTPSYTGSSNYQQNYTTPSYSNSYPSNNYSNSNNNSYYLQDPVKPHPGAPMHRPGAQSPSYYFTQYPGESIGERLTKNIVLRGLEAIFHELMQFFRHWTWPPTN